MRRQTAAEFIKERAGEIDMKKVERLELENAVLKNVIEYVQETIKIGNMTRENVYSILGKIKGSLDYERKMKFAMEHGIVDYRLCAETIGDCKDSYKRSDMRVVLNDGMVMGFEY